jgi:hypothetical protein
MAITAALIGATATAGAAGMGMMSANAASKNAQASNAIAMQNYLEQRRVAAAQEEMARAGSVDARGNTTTYVPGVGWVTNATPLTNQLINASDTEELRRYTADAMRNRLRGQNTFTRQGQEGLLADAALASGKEGAQSLNDIRALLTEQNVARAVSGANDLRNRISLNAIRQGSGGETAVAQLGRQSLMDTRSAIADANAAANPEFLSRKQGREGAATNQYNTYAARSTAPDGTAFMPTNLDEGINTGLASKAAMAQRGLAQAGTVNAPQFRYAEDRTPVAFAGLGSSLSGLVQTGNKYFNDRGAGGSSNQYSFDNPNTSYSDPYGR